MSIKSKDSKARWKRFGLYVLRAVTWFFMGICLEIGTSIIADGLIKSFEGFDNILGIFFILLAAAVAIMFNCIKARKSHPIYSMDNDLSTGLFVLFAVTGSFVENFIAGIINKNWDNLAPETDIWMYVGIGAILLVLAIILMSLDIIVIDKQYEKIKHFSDVDFEYKVEKWGEGYVKAVLRVNAAWIVAPALIAVICGLWMAFTISI